MLLLFLVAACGQPDWQTKDISGLMPDLAFDLIDEHGRHVTAADYRGHPLLLFFGYTSCPDVCPTTLAELSAVLGQLPDAARERVVVLFVSVDPGRDDPESLDAYTAAFGENFVGLTGSEDDLRALTRRYRVTFGYGNPDTDGNYEVSHSAAVFGFDARGRVHIMLRGSDAVDAITADLKHLAALPG